MKIINFSPVVIEIVGKPIKPNESYEIQQRMTTEININSDIGRCYIKIEYIKHIYAKCEGKLFVYLSPEEDEYGDKNIIIAPPGNAKK